LSTLIGIIKDHIKWRHQIFKLAKSDIIQNYSGSALGWAWALIKPTVIVLIFWFVFTVGLRAGSVGDGIPFILWLISGIVPWFYMDEMITDGSSSFIRYSYLITKMKFPIATIPTFVALAKLAIHFFLLFVVLAIFACFGRFPDIYFLQLPIYMFFMVLFFANWALFSSTFSAMSRDFLNLVMAFTTAVFWVSGILYDVRTVASPLVRKILIFNPITFIAEGYRDVFIYKEWIWDKPYNFAGYLVALIVMVVLANWSFRKLRKEIPDVL
jgi:teichoic acid transport system permease protein